MARLFFVTLSLTALNGSYVAFCAARPPVERNAQPRNIQIVVTCDCSYGISR